MSTNSSFVVVITGCSSGIGKSIALEFAKSSDFKVYATMRTPSKWDVEPIPNLVVFQLDVTSDTSVESTVNDILSREGKIDVLINNAGYALGGYIEQVYIDEAKALFETNVWGVVRMTQAVLPTMRRQRSGQIINMSSVAGIRGVLANDFYSGSKFALEGIMESMRYPLVPYNISVTNINAGPVKTLIAEKLLQNDGFGTRIPKDANDSQYLAALGQGTRNRLASGISQGIPSEDVGRLVFSLVQLKQQATAITDVPFNVGDADYAKMVLEKVRVHPTGWGGLSEVTLGSVPPLPDTIVLKKEKSERKTDVVPLPRIA